MVSIFGLAASGSASTDTQRQTLQNQRRSVQKMAAEAVDLGGLECGMCGFRRPLVWNAWIGYKRLAERAERGSGLGGVRVRVRIHFSHVIIDDYVWDAHTHRTVICIRDQHWLERVWVTVARPPQLHYVALLQ